MPSARAGKLRVGEVSVHHRKRRHVVLRLCARPKHSDEKCGCHRGNDPPWRDSAPRERRNVGRDRRRERFVDALERENRFFGLAQTPQACLANGGVGFDRRKLSGIELTGSVKLRRFADVLVSLHLHSPE